MSVNADKKIYDVIIVGAGPAGSSAAYFSGKNPGLKVLIVDRYNFPRYKCCAGGLFLTADWSQELENYKIARDKFTFTPCSNFNFHCRKKLFYKIEGMHLFDNIDRSEFDHELLKVALSQPNVSFQQASIKRIEAIANEGEPLYCLKYEGGEFYSKYVIGADGFRGVVSRALGNKAADKREFGICLQYDLVCEKIDPIATSVFLNWDKELGFSWLFPNSKGYCVGIGMIGKTGRSLREILDQFLDYLIDEKMIPSNIAEKRLAGAPCPAAVAPFFAKDRILLCGDALGSVRQLTGEGIYYAMKTGKIAAECVLVGEQDLCLRYGDALKPVFRQIVVFKKFPPVPLSKVILRICVKMFFIKLPFGWDMIFRKHIVNIFNRMYYLPEDSYYKPL